MAAQAVAQVLALAEKTEKAGEQVRLQAANLMTMLTLNIPGEASMLPDFLDRGGALMEQLDVAPGGPTTDRAIHQILVGRVATHIRGQIGVTANSPWTKVVKRLRAQYGGARIPYQRQAVTLISMARKKGETLSHFAKRTEEGAWTLRVKVFEISVSMEEAHQRKYGIDLLYSRGDRDSGEKRRRG